MDIATWASVATVAAGFASVGSLIAVAWQLKSLAKQTREAARQAQSGTDAVRASVYLTAQQTTIGISQFFIQHPDLRARFYGPVPGEGDQVDLHRLDATAEMIVDLTDMIVAHGAHMPPACLDGWQSYIGDLMRQSPHLRGFWLRNRTWFSPQHQRFIDESFAQTEPTAEPSTAPSSGQSAGQPTGPSAVWAPPAPPSQPDRARTMAPTP